MFRFMKNQYFGDVNDYRKYGLLRVLTGGGRINTAVCWMLTPDDGRGDGARIKCLSQPAQWRYYDHALFDHLEDSVLHRGARNVAEIEKSNLLPSCRFLSDLVPDDMEDRAAYLQRLMDLAQDCDLVFFDPDNGIQVPSKPCGRKHSSKYLYWQEIERFWEAGFSLLIYQHFPRVLRGRFIEGQARELMEKTGTREVISFHTSHVVFFLLRQAERLDLFRCGSAKVERMWGGQFLVAYHGM